MFFSSGDAWFSKVFGFPETDYNKTQSMFSYDEATGTLKSAKKDRVFMAGRLETPTLEEFRARTDLADAEAKLGRRQLGVEEIIADVSGLHSLPEAAGALFMAASQFNALEHTSQSGTPEQGITCYSSDRTQGPACAVSCAPGTVVRNYFTFGSRGGQTQGRQLRNLELVEEVLNNKQEKYFKVQNGYSLANNADLERLSSALRKSEDLQEAVRRKLRIAIQMDTEVVTSGFGAKMYEGPPQLVTQAYCSAIAVSYSRCHSRNWEAFARLILESAYESTLYAAVENFLRNPDAPGSRRVYLTALGGGVFGNDMEWIKDAMSKAFKKFQNIGLEIYLVSYGRSEKEMKQLEEEFPKRPQAA